MKIGGERVCFLIYADNVMFMAEAERKMNSMVKSLEEYLDRKRLILNVGETVRDEIRRERNRIKKAM